MEAKAQVWPRSRKNRARRNGAFVSRARRGRRAAGPSPGAETQRDPPHGSAVAGLEDVLVAELRLSQTIDALTEQEREAIASGDPSTVAAVARALSTCLAELARLEAEHDKAVGRLAQQFGLATDLTFEDLLPHLDSAIAQRLGVYRLGILAHLEHTRSLRPANRALARAAAGGTESWRRFLMRLAAGRFAAPAESFD